MTATTVYLVVALVAWPIIAGALLVKLNGLRRGPTFSTVLAIGALAAIVWPVGLVVIYLVPTVGR